MATATGLSPTFSLPKLPETCRRKRLLESREYQRSFCHGEILLAIAVKSPMAIETGPPATPTFAEHSGNQ